MLWKETLSWLRDALDIGLVATLIYQGYNLLAGTRAVNLIRGLSFFAVLWLLSNLLNLTTLNYLLGKAATIGIFAFIVVFQPEVRQILERIGRTRVQKISTSGASLQEIARALERMAEKQIGALIALEGQTPLGEHAASGVKLDALVSAPFLEALFARNAPLHDGGVIIQNDRVVAAGCLFPLQNLQDGIYRRYGTRHRAALGLSEVSDAVVLVVSEERGGIRIAHLGKLTQDLTGSELRDKLRDLLYGGGNTASTPSNTVSGNNSDEGLAKNTRMGSENSTGTQS